MTAIRFGGMASGLPPNIVDQLMDAERIPVKQMEANRGKSEAKLKLVEELTSKVEDIRKQMGVLVGVKGFTDFKLDSSDPSIVAGTVDPSKSMAGSWNIEVIQLAQKPAAVTNGLPDRDKTELGVGYLKFKTDKGLKEVYLNGKSNTLDGVAAAINAAGVGVRATVINDRKDKSNPFKLVCSGLARGDDNQIEFPTVYLLDGDQDIFFETKKPAQNGLIKMDGIEMEVNDNTLTDLIPGVTLQLRSSAPGKDVSVSVKEDYDVVSGKVKGFIDALNGVFSFIQGQNKLNEKTDTTKTLGGDGLLRNIEHRLHQLIQSPLFGIDGEVQRLSQLGIEFGRNGLLNLNQDKFNAILIRNTQDVQSFLAGDGISTGFAATLKRELSQMLDGSFGPLPLRKRGLEQKINQVNDRIANKERQLTRKEESLRRQFSKLEETMSRLKSQMGAVGAIGGGAPMVQLGATGS